jgi:hypothetical protein
MLLAWNDYYSGSGTLYQQRTGRLSSFSGTAYILNCFFNGLSSTSSGGSIYCSSSGLLMLIESSTFINSQSTNSGGALYISSSGQFVMVKVCGYGCKTTSSNYQFDYVTVTNDINSKNEIHDSVICHTYHESGYYETYHGNGKIIVTQTNFSSNKCYDIASIEAVPTLNGSAITSMISYSSVTNTTDVKGPCFYLSSSDKFYGVDSCNFISNKCPNSGKGVVLADGSLELKNSCFMDNVVYNVYNRGGKSVTVTNCTIDSASKYYGNIVTLSTPKSSFINKIKHLETALCYATYDSYGSLTVAPDSTKTFPNVIPPDKIEIILEMYCRRHMISDTIYVLNYLLIHFFISSEC